MAPKKLKIQFKVGPNGIIPCKAHASDAGYDLYASETVLLWGNRPKKVTTDISVVLPPDTVGDIRPRSSLNAKGVKVAYGTVDSGYRGELKVVMSAPFYKVHKGDKIAQLVVLPLAKTTSEVVTELPPSDRGEGGFGSTGK